jgi:hypothetical protein
VQAQRRRPLAPTTTLQVVVVALVCAIVFGPSGTGRVGRGLVLAAPSPPGPPLPVRYSDTVTEVRPAGVSGPSFTVDPLRCDRRARPCALPVLLLQLVKFCVEPTFLLESSVRSHP